MTSQSEEITGVGFEHEASRPTRRADSSRGRLALRAPARRASTADWRTDSIGAKRTGELSARRHAAASRPIRALRTSPRRHAQLACILHCHWLRRQPPP